MSSTQVRVGGTWLSMLGAVGDLEWSHRLDEGIGGCWEASWRMDLAAQFSHPALRSGQLVEIMAGPDRLWSGLLREPNRGANGWDLAADGVGRDEWYAFDGSLNTTSVPNTAIDQAISRGWQVTRPASISSSAFAEGDATDAVNTVQDLLGAWSDENSKRVVVGADRELRAITDPSIPDYTLIPGTAVPGAAMDGFGTVLYGRYRSTAGGYATATASDAEAIARWGAVERIVDLTPLGPISSTRAGNRLAGLLAKGKARLRFTEPLEAAYGELRTLGGVAVDLRFVRAGQLVRALGVTDETRPGALTVDVVIGETRYADLGGRGSIVMSPLDQVVGDFESFVADAVRNRRGR